MYRIRWRGRKRRKEVGLCLAEVLSSHTSSKCPGKGTTDLQCVVKTGLSKQAGCFTVQKHCLLSVSYQAELDCSLQQFSAAAGRKCGKKGRKESTHEPQHELHHNGETRTALLYTTPVKAKLNA